VSRAGGPGTSGTDIGDHPASASPVCRHALDSMATYDAILVPGGGVREGGQLPPWVRRRLDRAISLHRGGYIITLSAGTVYKPPPTDERGFPVLESVAGARYLVDHGVPPALVLAETCSYDTIGNAYFSRVVHVDPRGFRDLVVVTSAFHMARTEAIFRWIYGLPPRGYALSFEEVADEGIAPAALSARRRKEADALGRLPPLVSRIGSMAELHRWLFTENPAYAVGSGGRDFKTDESIGTY
jgi:hypothetical protein